MLVLDDTAIGAAHYDDITYAMSFISYNTARACKSVMYDDLF